MEKEMVYLEECVTATGEKKICFSTDSNQQGEFLTTLNSLFTAIEQALSRMRDEYGVDEPAASIPHSHWMDHIVYDTLEKQVYKLRRMLNPLYDDYYGKPESKKTAA